ncbi:ABC transporter substrate-binding protein [Microbacterium trichothecenolyticum]|uniref:ABC transporter substrate-binding protein n=1 Tax=Microbacterium trichothecenolyticum TaxID=69370 RepID=UPI001CB794DD|nr:LuxR C-terminal-related transcriptional regulator [Microbacterium trichothecenolyticum]
MPSTVERIWAVEAHDRHDFAPATFFAQHPELRAYATAARGLNRGAVVFTHVSGADWFQVSVREDPSGAVELVGERRQPPNGLTARELDVLTLIACGLGNVEIARSLGISATTVRTRVERVLARFGAKSRTAVAALAVEAGILRLPLPAPPAEESDLAVVALERARLRLSAAPRSALPRPWRHVAASAGRPFRLVSVLPASPDGDARRLGADLAVQSINGRGGVHGRFVEHFVVAADDREADGGTALSAAADLGADAVNWAFSDPGVDSVGLVQNAARLGRPFLHSLGSAAAVDAVRRSDRLRNVFQTCPGLHVYARGFAGVVQDAHRRGILRGGDRRIVVIGEDPTRVGSVAAGATGVDLVTVSSLADWPAEVGKLRAAPPWGVLVATWDPVALHRFLDAFFADPFPSLIHAVWVPGTPAFTRPLEDGIVWSSNIGRYRDGMGARFEREYRDAHGDHPSTPAGVGYDVVQLVARAWRAAWRPDSAASVAEAVREDVFRGVNGPYFFGSPGQASLSYPHETPDGSLGHARFTYQVQRGEHRIIGPASLATARLEGPWWLAGSDRVLRRSA